jgi:hypothetical protein
MKRPTERAQRNLYHMVNNTKSLVDNESQWTAQGVDLAALGRGPEYGWLNTFLEDFMNRVSKRATRVSAAGGLLRRSYPTCRVKSSRDSHAYAFDTRQSHCISTLYLAPLD